MKFNRLLAHTHSDVLFEGAVVQANGVKQKETVSTDASEHCFDKGCPFRNATLPDVSCSKSIVPVSSSCS